MRNEISHTRIGIIGAMQVEVDLLIQAMRSQGAVSMKPIASRGQCSTMRPSAHYVLFGYRRH